MERTEGTPSTESHDGRAFGSIIEFIKAAEAIKFRDARICIYGKRLALAPSKKAEAEDRYVLADDPGASVETPWAFFRMNEHSLRADVLGGKPRKFPFRISDKNIHLFRFDIF